MRLEYQPGMRRLGRAQRSNWENRSQNRWRVATETLHKASGGMNAAYPMGRDGGGTGP